MSTLYVGNLPFTATGEGLRTLFAEYGKVVALSMVPDRASGRAPGYALLEMSADDAARVMRTLNGTEFGGVPLRIDEVREDSGNVASQR
jgi:RNA recognition motif-containing protein